MKTRDVRNHEVLFFWAELQRTLYAAHKMSTLHFEALNAIPEWSWQLTKDKLLAGACWSIVEDARSDGASNSGGEANSASKPSDQRVDSPITLFGLRPNFTQADLRSAYAKKVALWHPDKLATMAPELQKLATIGMQGINSAYAKLKV